MTKHPIALAIALAFATSVALSGCDRISNFTALEHVQRAKDLQAKGDIKASIIELKNAIQKDPKNPQARWMLGELYIKSGLGSEAEKELKKARDLGVSGEVLDVSIGEALLLQGGYQRVLNDINPGAGTSSQNSGRIQAIRAEALLGLRRGQEACPLFEQSSKLDPSYTPTYWGLAKCAVGKNDLALANVHLRKALTIEKANHITWRLLGDLERLQNNWAAAEQAYVSALKIRPDATQTRISLAAVHVAQGRPGDARQEVTKAIESNPKDPLPKYMLAYLDFRQGKLTNARDHLQQVLVAAPEHAGTQLLSGAVNYGLASYEEAVTNLTKFLARYPRNAYARKLLAASFIRLGRLDQAMETISPILGSAKQDPELLVLGSEIYLRQNNPDKAVEYLEKAVALDPEDALLHLELGVGLLRTGNRLEALEELETAASLDPKQHKADLAIIRAHLVGMEYDKALDAIVRLEKKIPGGAAIYNLKAAAYLGKKDMVTAKKFFEMALSARPPSIAAAMNLAQLDMRENNLAAARGRFKTVLGWDKSNLEAMLGLAKLAAVEKKTDEVRQWLEKASKAHPEALAPHELLVQHYLAQKESGKALALAREFFDRNLKKPHALDLLGRVQLSTGNKESAASTFRELVNLTPNSPVALYRLALAQIATNNIAAARDSLAKALSYKPDYLEAQAALTSLEVTSGRHAEALQLAKQVQSQRPTSSVGYVMEGDVLLSQKQYGRAAQTYEHALSIKKDSTTTIKLHQAMVSQGGGTKADAGLLRWLDERPDDLAARVHLAESYVVRGLNRKAIEQYEIFLKRRPSDARALNNLAWLYYFEKDQKAIATAEKALKLAPESAQVQDTLGWLLVQEGKLAQGLALLKKASTQAPQAGEIHYHYAVALAKAGDKTQARTVLREALASKGSGPWRDDAQTLMRQLGQ